MTGNSEAQFLDALYRGVLDGTEFKRALEIAQSMFNCLGGAFVSIDAREPAGQISAMSGVFDEYGRLYSEQFIQIDPAPAIFARLAVGTASTTDRLLTPEERNALPFFNEFFVPIGLTETLAGNLFRDQARFSLLGLQRGDDRPPFEDEDIARLERLMPHIARALQLRRAFVRIEAKSVLLQSTIDRLPAGLALLGPQGNAIFVNATLQRLVQRGDGISLDRVGRPFFGSRSARQRFDALIDETCKGGSGGILRVARDNGARDYAVLVSPSPASLGQMIWDSPGSAITLVLVHDPDALGKSAPEVIEDALHIPKGAARLVAALAMDDDLKSFAEREGVTIHTARFHLHTALTRSGARTQAELVRLAVRILRDFALAEFGG